MSAEPINQWERFFIAKIKQGAAKENQILDEKEEAYLLTSMEDFKAAEQVGLSATKVFHKCVSALEVSHKIDVVDEDVEKQWRDLNVQLYRNSRRIISCVVQHWYLTNAWRQNSKVKRFVLYKWYSPLASKVWDECLVPKKTATPATPGAPTTPTK